MSEMDANLEHVNVILFYFMDSALFSMMDFTKYWNKVHRTRIKKVIINIIYLGRL